MRQLTNTEASSTCGGSFTDGYTISFAVSNAMLGACLGYLVGDYKSAMYGAAIFGSYALARIAAGELDHYLFSDRDNYSTIYTVEYA